MLTLGASGERAFLHALRKATERQTAASANPHLRVGIGDDCAVLTLPRGEELVVTTDLFLENVHFRRDWHTPQAAGHRCLARGLSDIAAMGARPLAAFLSFALPPDLAQSTWPQHFLSGLLALARKHQVPLAGGDTAQAPGRGKTALFTADIVLLGSVRRGRALLRSGAKPGDLLYVTGSLGGAAAQLSTLQRMPQTATARPGSNAHPHLYPQPRLAAGQALLGRASACIDLSDGLSTDLAHLCQESGVAAELDASRLPVHRLARRTPQALALALHGGEDYELLFTAPPRRRIGPSIAGMPVTCIGQLVAPRPRRPRVVLVTAEGRRQPLAPGGWEHFSHSGTRGC